MSSEQVTESVCCCCVDNESVVWTRLGCLHRIDPRKASCLHRIENSCIVNVYLAVREGVSSYGGISSSVYVLDPSLPAEEILVFLFLMRQISGHC